MKNNEFSDSSIYIRQLSGLIENLPASIYWKDKSGKYLGRNIAAAESMYELGLVKWWEKFRPLLEEIKI